MQQGKFVSTPKVMTLIPMQRRRLSESSFARQKEPLTMTWSDGLEEVVKLALAGTVGALAQRIYLQSKLNSLDNKVGQLERDIVDLKAKAVETATKTDLAREVASLQTIMELKLGSLGTNMQTLTALVQRALDKSHNV